MSEKKQFWLNVGLYLLFPVIGFVVGMLILGGLSFENLTETGRLGQGMWITWTSMIFGFFYFLAYVHFWDREGLSKLFKVLGIIFHVLMVLVCLLFGVGFVEDEGMTIVFGAGDAFRYALVLMPLFWWFIVRKVYCLIDYNVWSETTNLLFAVAAPVLAYLLAAVSLMFGVLYGLIAVIAIVNVAWVYYEGSLQGVKKFFMNFIYYLAMMVVGIVLATEVFPKHYTYEDLNAAFICGWVGVFCAFFHFLGWDLWAEKTYDGSRVDTNRFFVVVGIITTLVLGALSTAFVFTNYYVLAGMSEMQRSDFEHVFFNALYYTPIVFFMLRCPLYIMGYKKDWGSLMEWTVTMVFPVLCYVLSVIFLLIGFIIPFLVFVVLLVILTIVAKAKDGNVGFSGFSDYEPATSGGGSYGGSSSGGSKLSSVASCPGLADKLKYGLDHSGHHIGGWWIDKPWDLKAEYWDHSHSIDVTIKVTCQKGAYVADHAVISWIRPQIEKIIRKYQSDNPETKAVRFDINYNISVYEQS